MVPAKIPHTRDTRLALKAEEWIANCPTRRLMKASFKERPTSGSINHRSQSSQGAAFGYEGAQCNLGHPIAAEFALVRGLKSPRALRREQPGCAGADPESKPDRSLLPSSLRAIRRVVVATRESPFQSPVFQGGHILGP